MKTLISLKYVTITFFILFLTSCIPGRDGFDGRDGQDGQDATVYYSEWFSPSSWSGVSGDWYFEASAPDLTKNIVEQGVVLAYVWLSGDLYESTSVRPLPAFAVDANWSFLIHEYGVIEFTSDKNSKPLNSHKFRFIAIPGTIRALKSAYPDANGEIDLQQMTYQEVCKLYNIPE
ncbi:MAG: hypothetical protein ACERKD_19480 [Prolixibacteraceae bacterium]